MTEAEGSKKMKVLWVLRTAILLVFAVSLVSANEGENSNGLFSDEVVDVQRIGAEIEQALVKGDWAGAAKVVRTDDALTANPVARLILAHASLATNANNEATMLFFTVDRNEAGQWLQWAEGFARRHPGNKVALYLHADALARQGDFQGAREVLDTLLQKDPRCALAWNTRGVLHALDDNFNEALVDLGRAIRLKPDLVDAHINVGFVNYLLRSTPDVESGAPIEGFDKALKLDDECALAYLGRGCVLFALGKYDDAAVDFATAHLLCPVLAVAEINHSLAEMYALQQVEVDLVTRDLVAELEPGTTLETKTIMDAVSRRYEQREKEWAQQTIDRAQARQLRNTDFSRATPGKIRKLFEEHGRLPVVIAANYQIDRIWQKAFALNQESLRTKSSFDRWNTTWLPSAVGKETISTVRQALSLHSMAQSGSWNEFGRKGVEAAAPKLAARYSREAGLVADTVTTSKDPFNLGLDILEKALYTTEYVAEEMRGARQMQIHSISQQVASLALKTRRIESNLKGASASYSSPPTRLETMRNRDDLRQSLGLATSSETSISEVASIVNTFSSNLKPGDRIAILDADPLGVRARVAENSLRSRGFDPVVVPWNTETDTLMQQNIKGLVGVETGDSKSFHASRNSIGALLDDDNRRRFFPPPPPPNGGGRAGAAGGATSIFNRPEFPAFERPVHPLPSRPLGDTPGGVAMSMAHTMRDKGNWPVVAFSGLLYEAFLTTTDEKDAVKEGE